MVGSSTSTRLQVHHQAGIFAPAAPAAMMLPPERVIARRIHQEVLESTERLMKGPPVGETQRKRNERVYWLRVTRAEALLGLARRDEANSALAEAAGEPDVDQWMMTTTDEQIVRLKKLLR